MQDAIFSYRFFKAKQQRRSRWSPTSARKFLMEKMSAEKKPSDASQHRLSCTTCFDALYFCYSPVHQLQQYYRVGVLDNCYGKWNALWDCLYLKTKSPSQLLELLEAREKAKSHIWTFRTPEEAQSYWKQEFGHLDDMD